MDTTIRNIDAEAYRALKSFAALHGMTVGEALSEIVRAHVVGAPQAKAKRASLRDVPTFRFPPGNERLSEEVDSILYGA